MRRYLIISILAVLALALSLLWVGKAGDAVGPGVGLREDAGTRKTEAPTSGTDSELRRPISGPERVLLLSSRYGRERIRLIPFWQKSRGSYRRSLRTSFLAPLGSCSVTLVDEGGTVLHREGLQVAAGSNHIRIQQKIK